MPPYKFGDFVKQAIDEAQYIRAFGPAKGREIYQKKMRREQVAGQLRQAHPGQSAISGNFQQGKLVNSAAGAQAQPVTPPRPSQPKPAPMTNQPQQPKPFTAPNPAGWPGSPSIRKPGPPKL